MNIGPINAKATHEDLADKLQTIVDKIRNGNPDGVYRAVIVLDGKDVIESISLGAEMKTVEAVGLLEFAKLNAAFG